MKKNSSKHNPALPFQTIQHTAMTTGLSQYYLRNGCRDGSVPHVKSGSTYMINIQLLMERLNEQSELRRAPGS